jgi:hypothetical protein
MSEEERVKSVLAAYKDEPAIVIAHQIDLISKKDLKFSLALYRALAPSLKEEVAAIFEVDLIKDFKKDLSTPALQQEWLREASYGDPAEVVETFQLLADYIADIVVTRGSKVHPALKAFVQEMAKLSDDDYNSPEALAKVYVRVYDSELNQAPALKPNPFRTKPRVMRGPKP